MEVKPHENFERFQCGEVQPPMEVEPHGTSDLTKSGTRPAKRGFIMTDVVDRISM